MEHGTVDFIGVTPEVFAKVKEGMEDAGFDIPGGEQGAVHGRGVKARFEYDSGSERLRLRLDEVPVIVSSGYLVGRVHDLLQQAVASFQQEG